MAEHRPFSDISYDRETRVGLLAPRGPVDAAMILGLVKQLLTHDDAAAINGVIWDMRGSDLSGIDLGQMQEVWSSQPEFGFRPELRIASVMADDIQASILALWAAAAPVFGPMSRRACRSVDEARAWILEGAGPT